MLRKIRVIPAVLFFTAITLLFLDFSGVLHPYLAWTAKIQLVPALLALNFITVAALVLLTLLFGRFYCSVICPLGIFQDIVSWISGRRNRKRKKYRFGYKKALPWLRYTMLAVFIIALVAGIGSWAALLEPYSAFGRMVQNLLSPVYLEANNLCARIAEQTGSYAFYEKEIWIRGLSTFIIAATTFVIITVLAWVGGRTWCNTVCPVGTVLGFLGRFAWFKPVIETEKCVNCGLCGKGCKAHCIDTVNHKIDYSRCVGCMDCLENCSQKAISYKHTARKKKAENAAEHSEKPDTSRRSFLTAAGLLVGGAAVHAAEKKVDGGLAVITDKKIPERQTPIVPPGAQSLHHLRQHCTGCQLCVAACPNNVLRPSGSFLHLMQPESSYEKGYCRPECTKCSEVCPTGAIRKISREEKSSVKIGHAVWIRNNCTVITDGVQCNNCARHCPAGAIHMVPLESGNPDSLRIPAVNEADCIGCGACENLCPARPFSAIYVEGHEVHEMK